MSSTRRPPRPHTKRVWSTADIRYIERHWQQQTDAELAAHFGVSRDALALFRWRVCKLTRPRNTSQLCNTFRPGNRPWNADKKGKPFLGSTKAGNPVWHVVLYDEHGGRRCVTLARAVWERAGRAVPAGHFVVQLSGDPANPQLHELQCVDRRGLGRVGNRRISTPRSVSRAKCAETLRKRRKVQAYLGGPQIQLGA